MPSDDIYGGRRALVTGDTGFKGSWLCQWLLKLGAEVHSLADTVSTSPALFEMPQLVPLDIPGNG